jgi:CubicO group peptidase (beta-lactamase class C family)
MKQFFWFSLAALLLAACTAVPSVEFSGDLQVGELVEGSLELETPDTFYVDFGANTYLYGVCMQLTVDVQVSLYDSAGSSLGLFDGPGTGPETFSFEISEAGRYMLEVAPFEEETGDYTLELKVVEPLATDPEKRADQLFYPYMEEGVPGGVVGVIKDGQLVFSKAYGLADLTFGIPFDVSTPTNIGSVSKQFTAMAILLLEQEGKLSLEDDVRKYIPELPDLGEVVRIKNMLNHTNGFREVYNLMPMTGWKGEDVLRRQEVIEMLKRQEKLQNAPGEEYNYNNSAFILLAEIVERISGEKFPVWMEENVFAPLEMTSTLVRTNPVTLIPGASQGYTLDSLAYKETGDLYAAYGAGGIYTTPADFARWMSNFNDPVLGGKEVIALLVRVDTLNNGDTMTYARGIGVEKIRGLSVYSHGGADLAHRAFATYFPEINSGVVAFSNNANFNARKIAIEMAEVYFGEMMEPKEKEAVDKEGEDIEGEEASMAEIVVPEDLLQSYAGRYIIAGMGMVLEYSVKDGVLKMNMEGQPEASLTPLSLSEFKYEAQQASILFKTNDQGKVSGAVHSQGGQKYNLEAIPPYEPTMEEIRAFTGSYFSKELDVFYNLEIRDSTLVILLRNTPEIKLSVLKEDVYKGDVFFIGEVEFQRDKAGRVTGFEASNGRTKGIGFERL